MAAAINNGAAVASNPNPAAASATPAQQAPTASGAAAPAPAPPWFASIQDADLRGFAESEGLKEPVDAVRNYRELKALRGVPPDQLLKLPGKDAKPEDWAPVYDKLGRPKTAEDYKLTGLDGTSTDDFAVGVAQVLHKGGANLQLAKDLNEFYNGYAQKLIDQRQKDRDAQWAADELTLHQEWPGQVYNERMELAKRAARSYGFNEDIIDKFESVIGPAEVYRWFAKIGEGQGEGGKGFERGNVVNANFGMTPEGAQAQLEALHKDKEFGRKFIEGDAEANARHDRLLQIINSRNSATPMR